MCECGWRSGTPTCDAALALIRLLLGARCAPGCASHSLAVQVQEGLGRDPHAGDLYAFRGKRGHLIKSLWHDGIGMSLYAKRLERGRFIWPSPADGTVAITPAQLAYMLDGIDWRNPVRTWRPEAAG